MTERTNVKMDAMGRHAYLRSSFGHRMATGVLMVSENGMGLGVPAIVGDATGG